MSKPSEQDNTNNIYSSSEDFVTSGERARVERDEQSVYDDLMDYKFLKPKREHSGHKSRRSRGRKKMRGWQKALIIVGSVLLSLVILVAGVTAFLVNKGRDELIETNLEIVQPENIQADVQDDGQYIRYNGATYKYNEDVTNIMFMGVDKRDMDQANDEGTGGQSDANVMIAMNFKTHKITMIAIPRDVMTDVALYTPGGNYNGMKKMQICMAYAYGDGKEKSCENTISAVKNIFYNIPVKTYYSLDLDGIIAINDAVGGVDVVSPETLGERLVEGQSYHLEGEMSEHFVRFRDMEHIDGSAKRLERQKVYARSFISTLLSQTKKDISTPVNLFNQSAPYSCTNLNPSKIAYLAKEFVLGGGMETEILSVPGETQLSQETGYTEFTIDEKAFFELFLSVYYEKM